MSHHSKPAGALVIQISFRINNRNR